MPESAGCKSDQAGAETRLLASGRNAEIDVVAKPVVGIHVPPGEVRARVLGSFNRDGVDVLQPVPRDLACNWVDSVVSEASQDAGTFRQSPYSVILETSYNPDHVHDKYATDDAMRQVRFVNELLVAKVTREGHKEADPAEAGDGLDHSRGAAARNLALLANRGLLGGVDACRDFEHGCVNPALVVDVVKGGTGHQGWEEENICGEIQDAGEVLQGTLFLEVGEVLIRQLAIGNVPAKGT